MNDDNTRDGAEPSLASDGSQPVAYEVWWDGAARQPYFVSADEKPSEHWTPAPRCVPLYRSPALTDEERFVLREVRDIYADEDDVKCNEIAAVIDGLLERTK
jgi:hypothetical protein